MAGRSAGNCPSRRADEDETMKCIDCGAEIPKERLELLPYTPYCVKCSERHPPASADPNLVCARPSITVQNGFGPSD
jgi:Prokaryotic dksA/traR C4-type zinc finger